MKNVRTKNRIQHPLHWWIISLFMVCMGVNTVTQAALTVGETYTVVMSKVNSDGTTTVVSSTSAVADANGKITFSLSNVPTSPTTNFVLLELKDSTNTTVRRSIAPAPPSGSDNLVGVNELSATQASALLNSMSSNTTDDPIPVGFGLVFVRSPNLQTSDITILSQMMATAILGNAGFENFLLQNGVTSAQLTTMREKLIYNSATNAKDMRTYMAYFKNAVDNPSSASDEMAKAGGLMADIFIDAGAAANIDPTLILAAFNAAGDTGVDALMQQLTPSFAASIQQAVTGFFTRVAAVKLKREYTDALSTLGASGSEVTRFNTATQNLVAAQQSIDTQYADFFMNPENYTDQQAQTIRTAIDTAFQNAFTSFKSDLQSSSAEITSMKTAIAAGLTVSSGNTVNVSDLPPEVGTERDFNGNTVNWPIPQTVSVSWVANILSASGSFSYTRDTLAVPTNMQNWLDSDENPNNGIDGLRTDFTSMSMPVSFAALMGLMQDVQIVEHTRFSIYEGGQPTPAQEKQARLDYQTNLNNLLDNISGTTDGTTAISTAQKKALLKLMQEPSLY